MIDSLRNTYYRLVNELNIDTYRYLYDSFDISGRLIGLIGPRGVGKTTLLLQFIKHKVKNLDEAFYFSADHIYFSKITLFDFVQELYENEGTHLFFIDEVHKYKNWNQELKNIYDSFPRIKVVFSGSSSIDLIRGTYDLSRRGILYNLKGLSFREYLSLKTGKEYTVADFKTVVADNMPLSSELSQIPKIKGYFKEYLQKGYYPFVFEKGGHYYERIGNIVEKTIFEDIANFFNLPTANLHYFKKILYCLSTIPPGEINIHNLAGNLGIDDKTALNYVSMLQKTGLVTMLFSDKRGGSLVRKPEKVFLENTTMYHSVCFDLGQIIDTGTIRELFFINTLINSGENVFYSKNAGDYKVNEIIFEIGGKSKKGKQIRNLKNEAFQVKDDILVGNKSTIPLYLFGFQY